MDLCEVKNQNFQEISRLLLKRAWEAGDFSDVTLVSEDGALVNAHRIVLSSCSDFFESILKKHAHPNPLIFVKGVPSNLLSSIVAFLYNGQVDIAAKDLDKFMETCAELKIENGTSALLSLNNYDQQILPKKDQTSSSMSPNYIHPVPPFLNHQPIPDKTLPSTEEDVNSTIEQNASVFPKETEAKAQPIKKEIQAKSGENTPSKLKMPDYHTSKYPKPKNLVCNLCDYRVHRNDLLKLHMNSKHNMEKFFCAVQGCGRYYSSKINLKHHKKVNHDCEVCGISLPGRDDLKLHKKQWHTNQ